MPRTLWPLTKIQSSFSLKESTEFSPGLIQPICIIVLVCRLWRSQIRVSPSNARANFQNIYRKFYTENISPLSWNVQNILVSLGWRTNLFIVMWFGSNDIPPTENCEPQTLKTIRSDGDSLYWGLTVSGHFNTVPFLCFAFDSHLIRWVLLETSFTAVLTWSPSRPLIPGSW